MADFRRVTAEFSVSPQIAVADVAAAAEQGFVMIVNNRPDGEVPGQTPGAAVEAAAKARGVAYRHIPVRGMPGRDEIEAMRRAVAESPGPVLAYCRSGNRSIIAWAAGEAAAGRMAPDDLIERGAAGRLRPLGRGGRLRAARAGRLGGGGRCSWKSPRS